MKRYIVALFGALIAVAGFTLARADVNYTQGLGTVIFDFTCFTTKHCSAHVPIDSTGSAFGVTGNPFFMGFGTGVTLPAYAAIPTFKIDQTTPGTTNLVAAGLASGKVASGAYAAGAFASGAGVDGWDLTQGAKADSACGSSTGTCSVIAILKYLASIGLPVTNTNPNGAAVAASSSPTAPPTDYVSGKPISSLVKGTTASMTSTTSTQLLAAVTSKVIYVMNVDCVNSSSTATLVTLQDGSGGTALGTVAAAASGGGHAIHATFPETWTTSGNGLYVANVTGSAAVICTASGFAQ